MLCIHYHNFLSGQKMYFFFNFLFKFELVNIQYNIGFRSTIQWFITYIQHPVLITSALFNTHHPSSPSLTHLPPSTVSLFPRVKSLLWLVSLSLFLVAEKYSTVYKYHIFFIHSSVNGYLGSLHSSAIDSAAINIGVRVPLWNWIFF